MFPDRAALYVVAIEDRQYKDFKIHCKSPFHSALNFCCTLGVGATSVGPRWSVSVMDTATIPVVEFVCDSFWILLCISLQSQGWGV